MGLQVFMEQHGVLFEVRRAGATFQAKGLRNNDRRGEYIGFYPNTDIRVGDTLFSTVTCQEFHVTAVDYHLVHGEVFQVKAYFESTPRREVREAAPANIIHIEQMSNSLVQQSTVGSTQSASFSPMDLQAVSQLIQDLKARLPELHLVSDDVRAVESDIATVEAQLSSPRPKTEMVRECLRSIRSIAEDAAGSMAAAGIIQGITKLLGG